MLQKYLRSSVAQSEINKFAPADALEWKITIPDLGGNAFGGVSYASRTAKIIRHSPSHDWVFVEFID